MLQMKMKYLLVWRMWIGKKLRLVYRRPLFKPKNMGKGGKNGNGFVLKENVTLKINFMWIPNLSARTLRLKKLLNF